MNVCDIWCQLRYFSQYSVKKLGNLGISAEVVGHPGAFCLMFYEYYEFRHTVFHLYSVTDRYSDFSGVFN